MAVGAKVTKNGKNYTWQALFNTSFNTKVVKFKIGTGNATPTENDTDLQSPVLGWNAGSDFGVFLPLYPQYDPSTKKVIIRGQVAETQANGNTLQETGLFFSDNTIFSRDVHIPIVKNPKTRIIYEWTHTFV
jgi:hypothetical protein